MFISTANCTAAQEPQSRDAVFSPTPKMTTHKPPSAGFWTWKDSAGIAVAIAVAIVVAIVVVIAVVLCCRKKENRYYKLFLKIEIKCPLHYRCQ